MSSIGKTRNTLYKTARILGDIQAEQGGGAFLSLPIFFQVRELSGLSRLAFGNLSGVSILIGFSKAPRP